MNHNCYSSLQHDSIICTSKLLCLKKGRYISNYAIFTIINAEEMVFYTKRYHYTKICTILSKWLLSFCHLSKPVFGHFYVHSDYVMSIFPTSSFSMQFLLLYPFTLFIFQDLWMVICHWHVGFPFKSPIYPLGQKLSLSSISCIICICL